MHAKNNEKTIGRDFFLKPSSAQAVRLEHVYNSLFGALPCTLTFSEEFEYNCLEKIFEFFSPFTCTLVKTKLNFVEEGIYLGREKSVFEDMLVSVDFRTPDGETVFFEGRLIDFSSNRSNASVNVESLYVRIRVACGSKQQAQKFAELLDPYKVKDKSQIYMLSNSYGDLSFSALRIDVPKIDLELNYGKDFIEISDKFISSLNEEKSGLYLLHGDPGTGKSSYIKYLCSGVVKRKIVYIPIGLISNLTSPDMIPLLMENKDIIMVIEDAEKALISRDESGRSDLVSTILNLTDGFLGQALNITVVATFNTAKEKIDEALLRKGRLKQCYEFPKLSTTQAIKLAKHLNLPVEAISSAMTLADIYHIEKETGYTPEEQRRVGFF